MGKRIKINKRRHDDMHVGISRVYCNGYRRFVEGSWGRIDVGDF